MKHQYIKTLSVFTIFIFILISNSFATEQYTINNFYYYGNPYNIPYNNPYNFAEYFSISSYFDYGNEYYNGEAMFMRRPIFSGYDQYYVNVANNLMKPCYESIDRYLVNEFDGKYQGAYLNSACIENQNPKMINLIVNCALKKNSKINSFIEFKVNLDLVNNRFSWTRKDNNQNKRRKKLLD